MPEGPAPQRADAQDVLGVLHRLTLEACRAESPKALNFRILNNTIHLLPYDRAVLWSFEGRTPKLLGVSGQQEASRTTDLAEDWVTLVEEIEDPDEMQVLGEEDFDEETWERVESSTPGLSLLWIPLVAHKRLVGGLWLERWDEKPWRKGEPEILTPLADGYGAAWEKFARQKPLVEYLPESEKLRIGGAIAAVILVYALFLHWTPLRVVAPCEVIPEDPFVVAAPLDGVIEEVTVLPGKRVERGDLLFVYDKRITEQELKIARRQVNIIQAQLDRVMADAFQAGGDQQLADLVALKLRLKQEELRLELAEYTHSRLEVRAENAGWVMMDDPHGWRGRPVVTGQRVLAIIDRSKTRLRVWLAEDDNVGINDEIPIDAYLNVAPSRSLRATVDYVASSTTMSPAHVPSFIVEAEWDGEVGELQTGLKGTAFLYGPRTSSAYAILRKPWTSARRFLGY